MTENEKLIKSYADAIDCLKKNKPTSGYYMLQESVDMAVNALEEIEQYRAIGTVEECQTAAGLLLIATYEIGIHSVAHYGVNCKNN